MFEKLPTFCSVSHSNAFTDMHLPISSKVFLNVHDAKNSKAFSRLFQLVEKQYFCDREKSVSARFIFAFVVALFLSMFSLGTEYLFVGLS